MHVESLHPGDHVTVLLGESRLTPLLGGPHAMSVVIAGGGAEIVEGGECAPAAIRSRDRSMEGAVFRVQGVNAPFVVLAVVGTSLVGAQMIIDTRAVRLSHVTDPVYRDAVLALQEENIKAYQPAQPPAASATSSLEQQAVAAAMANRHSTDQRQGGCNGQG
jgi:hypothetical protein